MSGGFEALGLLPEFVRATEDMGWFLPSDVQDEAIPLILGGGDVLAAAETGSGKTGAFALPAIQQVYEGKLLAAKNAKDVAPSVPMKFVKYAAKSSVQISEDGLEVTSNFPKFWDGARGNKAVKKGNTYFEVTILSDGLARVGWTSPGCGDALGTESGSFGYGGTGKISNSNDFSDYGEKFGSGDVIGCYLQLNGNRSISFSKNGKNLGVAFQLGREPTSFYPAVYLKECKVSVNFGDKPFRFNPPKEFPSISKIPVSSFHVESTGSLSEHKLRCLVLVSSRDLVLQVAKVFQEFCKYIPDNAVKVESVVAGIDDAGTKRRLKEGVDIIVSTPQRILDMAKRGEISLSTVEYFILDEADHFIPENVPHLMCIYHAICGSMNIQQAANRLDDKRLFSLPVSGEVIESTQALAHARGLQVCFFSATLHSPEVRMLSNFLCRNPIWVDLKGDEIIPSTLHHVFVDVDPVKYKTWEKREAVFGGPHSEKASKGGKSSFPLIRTDGVHGNDKIIPGVPKTGKNQGKNDEYLSEGLKRLKFEMLLSLIDSFDMEQVLVFCRTNVDCDNLEEFFINAGGGVKWRHDAEKGKENKYSCCVLAGRRSMEERQRNLDAFKEGNVRILIATDVGARGLDIRELPYVINLTLPSETPLYIHRIGRVGRAGRMGLAISLVSSVPEKVWYHTCDKKNQANCTNTRLVPNGCTIWYNEQDLRKDIERVVSGADRPTMGNGEKIHWMNITPNAKTEQNVVLPYLFTLPDEIKKLNAVYGEGGVEKETPLQQQLRIEAARRLKELEGTVNTLALLELRSQGVYHAIRSKFGTTAAPIGQKNFIPFDASSEDILRVAGMKVDEERMASNIAGSKRPQATTNTVTTPSPHDVKVPRAAGSTSPSRDPEKSNNQSKNQKKSNAHRRNQSNGNQEKKKNNDGQNSGNQSKNQRNNRNRKKE